MDEIRKWYSDDAPVKGIATICGAVSGNLELLDFDHEAERVFIGWQETVGLMAHSILDRVHIARTPKGFHVRYRVAGFVVPGNQQLASAVTADGECITLIETRGEGGYALAPGCPPECHESGKTYHDFLKVTLWDAIKHPITTEERGILISAAASFHEAEPRVDITPDPFADIGYSNGKAKTSGAFVLRATGGVASADRKRPGDDFNEKATWPDVLEPHGWKQVGRREDGTLLWRRPGKNSGCSATSGYCKTEARGDLLHVFSSNADRLKPGSYSKFEAHTFLTHGGDFVASTAQLGRDGYGDVAKPKEAAKSTDPVAIEIYSLPDLLALDIPPPRWAVPGILSQGLTLLAGAPKQGKSWLALNLAITISAGGMALGNVPVDAGDVLYLCLEDRLARVQSRARKILGGIGCKASARLKVAIAWPRMDQGGMEEIERWAATVTRPTLFIIDVWQKFKPTGDGRKATNQYEDDYRYSTELKSFADGVGASVIAVHHTKKGRSEDWLEDVSGTLGLGGAADGVLVLQRTRGELEAKLCMTGRDIDEQELALKFDPDHAIWTSEGNADERAKGELQKAIMDVFTRRPATWFTAMEMAALTNRDPKSVRATLYKLADKRLIEKEGSSFIYPSIHDTPVHL